MEYCSWPKKSCDFVFLKYLLLTILFVTSFLTVASLLEQDSEIRRKEDEYLMTLEQSAKVRNVLSVQCIVSSILQGVAIAGTITESIPLLIPTGMLMFLSSLEILPMIVIALSVANVSLIQSVLIISFIIVLILDSQNVKSTNGRRYSVELDDNQINAVHGRQYQWSVV
ncbi:hypothetical protein HDE_04958 [Halotydeus destructor]|nr:hypothetical protein HDE_04958 [Halotydeus destructor]